MHTFKVHVFPLDRPHLPHTDIQPVAYKRFVDNVSMAIDHELVLGLNHGRALEAALLKGLGIAGPDGFQRCKEFLQESPHVMSRREELQKRYERLESAKKELMDLCI